MESLNNFVTHFTNPPSNRKTLSFAVVCSPQKLSSFKFSLFNEISFVRNGKSGVGEESSTAGWWMWRKNRKEIITIVQMRKCSYSISAGKLEGWQQRCHSFQQYRNENEPQNVLIENLFRLVSFSTFLLLCIFSVICWTKLKADYYCVALSWYLIGGREKSKIILEKDWINDPWNKRNSTSLRFNFKVFYFFSRMVLWTVFCLSRSVAASSSADCMLNLLKYE